MAEQLAQRREKIKEFDTRFATILTEAKAKRAEFDTAVEAHVDAKNNLPAGDPAIESTLATAKALGEELKALKLKGYAILDEKADFLIKGTA